MIIIPIKWLFHWEYTLFLDKPMCAISSDVNTVRAAFDIKQSNKSWKIGEAPCCNRFDLMQSAFDRLQGPWHFTQAVAMVRAVAQAVWIIWIAPECLFSNQTQNIESDKVFHIYTHHGYCPCWSAIVQCTSSMPCFDPLTQGCSFSLTSFPQTNHTPSRGLWRVWLRIVRWYYTEE